MIRVEHTRIRSLTFSDSMPDYPPTGLDDTLAFGKHEGTKLWVVLETDPTYVRWLIEDADLSFQLDDEAWEKYQEELARYEKYEDR
jgi:hypothetical protein